MRHLTRLLCALVAFVMLAGCGDACSNNGDGQPWTFEDPEESESTQPLDCTNSVSTDHRFLGGDVRVSAVAVDVGPNHCPRVLLNRDGVLAYAFWDGTRWKMEEITSFPNVFHADIAVDSEGRPHVAYSDYINETITYAVSIRPGQWEVERVADFGATELNIRVTPNDAPAFMAIERVDTATIAEPRLHYFDRVGGSWRSEQLMEESQINDLEGSFNFDDAGRPVFAMASGVWKNKLTFGLRDSGGEWALESLELERFEAERTTLVHDASDGPLLVFGSSRDDKPLRLAALNGLEWETASTPVNAPFGRWLNSSFLDGQGRLHVIHGKKHALRADGQWYDLQLDGFADSTGPMHVQYDGEQRLLHVVDSQQLDSEPFSNAVYRAVDFANFPATDADDE